jgi:hypothetical protein
MSLDGMADYSYAAMSGLETGSAEHTSPDVAFGRDCPSSELGEPGDVRSAVFGQGG